MTASSFIYLGLHFALCFVLFALIQKPLFMALNRKVNTARMSARDVADIYRVGYVTDMIAAAYLTLPPLLVMWVHWHVPTFSIVVPLIVVDAVVALLIALSSIADIAVYPHWLFKLDASAFAYLKSLKGAFASLSGTATFLLLAGLLLVWGAIALAFVALINLSGVDTLEPMPGVWGHLAAVGMFVLSFAVLFLVVRGVDHRPHTPCDTFYSTNMFYNHSALNPLYNVIYSLSVTDHPDEQFKFMDKEECDAKVRAMFPTGGKPELKLLNTDRPNILFIMWESLSARFVAPLGGKEGVLPNFDKACKEGILFTHVDAGSFRTDRGLVCLLSGYLGQPTMSIMRNTRKLPSLPAIPKTLRENGYTTYCVHGGDLTIMHKIDYYLSSGHDNVQGIESFPADAPACRWGIHDNFMFERVTDQILERGKDTEPWFETFQTLSSHTPYKVPYNRLTERPDNAFAFTDEAFGKMVERLKASPVWDNLLIIVSGDHGLNDPALTPLPRKDYVHIPILWLGGAVKKPMEIDTMMAQSDLPATLLGQLGIAHDRFIFSRDILSPEYKHPFTFHAYTNGFMIKDEKGLTDYDNEAAKAMEGPDEARELQGRMILQTLYDDISSR